MKEIGGYPELDRYSLPMLHEGALALNSGRACLMYLIKQRGIKEIALPRYICDTVIDACELSGASIVYYSLNEELRPVVPELPPDCWFYAVNYYGSLSEGYISGLSERCPRMILDNAQAYYVPAIEGMDTLYSCRKFFGVADGGFLYTDAPRCELERDESFARMRFVLGRFERGASEFYGEAAENNGRLTADGLRSMSALTLNLLQAIDYEAFKNRRERNYARLERELGDVNELKLSSSAGPYAYPLMLSEGDRIRKALISRKIYVPLLWPNIIRTMPEDSPEYRLADNILPLPVDQRYCEEDMDRIVEAVRKEI